MKIHMWTGNQKEIFSYVPHNFFIIFLLGIRIELVGEQNVAPEHSWYFFNLSPERLILEILILGSSDGLGLSGLTNQNNKLTEMK